MPESVPGSSVKTRIADLLLSSRLADVEFLVGNNGRSELFPAHKVVLASASEVFEAMLYGQFNVPEVIQVPDTTPESFRIMLNYVYIDAAELSRENVFSVLYLAKKYRLTRLIRDAYEFCADTLAGSKVVELLPQLHLFDEEHAEIVWSQIETNAEAVLKSPAFLRLSHAIVCDILERQLDVDEVVVYDRLVVWGRAECQRRELADGSENMRMVIGDAMKLVRFPLMSQKEFSEGPWEKVKVFIHFNLGETPLHFSTVERRSSLHVWKRFDTEGPGNWTAEYAWSTWCLDFYVDDDIRIAGFGLYGSTLAGKTYKVRIELKNKHNPSALASKVSTYTTVDGQSVYRVMFDEGVKLTGGVVYRATAHIDGPDSPYGTDAAPEAVCKVRDKSVKFTVIPSGSKARADYDVSKKGQIPELYFK
ncbi:Btbd6 protein [Aphelenchoides avenae]|nr:Btbd6 protein [Aphelenchus avenae]